MSQGLTSEFGDTGKYACNKALIILVCLSLLNLDFFVGVHAEDIEFGVQLCLVTFWIRCGHRDN